MMASHIRNNYSDTSTRYYNYYGSVYYTLVNDYDRVDENDDNLDVLYRVGSKNYSGVNGTGNYHDLAYLITVKSGKKDKRDKLLCTDICNGAHSVHDMQQIPDTEK